MTSESAPASEAALPLPAAFSFTYSDEELDEYSALCAARFEPDDGYTFFGSIFAAIFVVGGAVLLANHLGLVSPLAMRPVLITAYVAFCAGAGAFYAMWAWRSRAARRLLLRELNSKQESWEAVFDDAGIVWRRRGTESRAAWDAVEGIGETARLVTIWMSIDYGIPIPARLFADAPARKAFVAAMRARVSAAKIAQPK